MNHINPFKSFTFTNEKLVLSDYYLTPDEIINYITEITPHESDVPDYYFSLVKKSGKKFHKKQLKISELLNNDISLKEYVEHGEERYGDSSDSYHEPEDTDLEHPIVVFDGFVIDGYNRTLKKYHMGEEYIDAYVSI